MPNPSRRGLARSAPGNRPARAPARAVAGPVAPRQEPAATLHRNVRGLGQKRRDRDLYETPPDCALAICKRLARLVRLDAEPKLIEPSAGSGNFVRAMRAVWRDAIILAIDLHAQNARLLHAAGATSYITGRWQNQNVKGFAADLTVGNLPFSEAEEHIHHGIDMMPVNGWLACLLPTTFLATQGRSERLWTPERPGSLVGCGGLRYFWPLAERPSYTNDGGTDMTEYGVYVWRKGYTLNPEMLPPLWWKEKNRERHDA